MGQITCAIDWGESQHDVALVDESGTRVARARISDDAAGYARLLELLAEHGDSEQEPIPVAIETPRGLLVAALRSTGRQIYPINPWAVARYRERHSVARKKSDAGDALVLANILRTDISAHRPLPADSELARAIRVLARARQDAVWDRTTLILRLRSLLREYHPGMLAALTHISDGLATAIGRALLAEAPDPERAAALTPEDLGAVLVKAGRERGILTLAQQLHAALQRPQM